MPRRLDPSREYYLEHYLKHTRFDIDCRTFYPEDQPELESKLDLTASFEFDGLADGNDRTAILRHTEVHDKFVPIFVHEMRQVMKDAEDEDRISNSKIMVQVRRELTDMPPLDMESCIERNDYTIRFDWRIYFCILMSEQRLLNSKHDSDMKVPFLPCSSRSKNHG